MKKFMYEAPSVEVLKMELHGMIAASDGATTEEGGGMG